MTDLDTAALDGIAARAVAATPGIENRWRVMSSSRYGRADETEVDAGRFTWACRWAGPPAGAPEQVQADAAHIAGMDPATTLALVAEVRRLRDDVARHGDCLCDYNTGPEETCPQHGRTYAEWVERCDVLADRQARVREVLGNWDERARDRILAALDGPAASPCVIHAPTGAGPNPFEDTCKGCGAAIVWQRSGQCWSLGPAAAGGER